MKKTAIDHIYEQFISLFTQYEGDEIDGFRFGELITEAHEQAKAMENEQIIDAYNEGYSIRDYYGNRSDNTTAEQYYNETFNQ
ncbi:MAG: hypothetical protein ACK5QC_10965 [Bacteroidota bacterium]